MFWRALFLVALLLSGELRAAAWTLPEGQGQVIVNQYYFESDRFTNATGRSLQQSTYRKFETNPYIKYGFSDSLTVGVSPSFQYVEQRLFNRDVEQANIGDTELFLRARLYHDEKRILSIQPLVKLPGVYDTKEPLALGQGQVDAELRLLYGYNFGSKGRHYFNTEAAYRHRLDTPGDELRLATTLGIRLSEDWQFLTEMSSIYAVDGAGGNSPVLLSNSADFDLSKMQISVVYWLNPKWALQLGGYHSLYSRNTGEGGGALVAVWYRF